MSTAPRGWSLFGDPAERAARRAYRRSLPPLYRWRRVLVALLLVAGAVGLVAALAGDPVTWTRQRWYDVTGRTEALPGVDATAVPEGSVRRGFSVAGLVDGDDRTAWATDWPATTVVSAACGGTAGVGAVQLTWAEAVRVRGLAVRAGLDDKEPARDAQYHPRRLDILLADGRCLSRTLADRSGWQPVDLDTETEVDSLVLMVGDVTPATGQAPQAVVALSGVQVRVSPVDA